jgi:hypothetical protein
MAQTSPPSVKGSLVLGAAVTLRRHRDAGRVSADQLAARLGPEATELLDQKIDVGRWYPAQAFIELLETDWDLVGRRAPEHMREQGARAADRLFQSGIYQQLRYAEEADRVKSTQQLARQAKLITTITGSLYSFLSFDVRMAASGEALEIVYGNATLFSEALRYSTEGFMNQINERQGSAHRWTSERTAPDTIVFTLPVPRRLLDAP